MYSKMTGLDLGPSVGSEGSEEVIKTGYLVIENSKDEGIL